LSFGHSNKLHICHFTVATGGDIRKLPFGDASIDFLRALQFAEFNNDNNNIY
jgi:hypothetical protein